MECRELVSAVIPVSVKSIGVAAFSRCRKLEKVTVMGNEVRFSEEGFYSVDQVFYGCGKHLTIYAPKGSTAEEYAKRHSIPFEAI